MELTPIDHELISPFDGPEEKLYKHLHWRFFNTDFHQLSPASKNQLMDHSYLFCDYALYEWFSFGLRGG